MSKKLILIDGSSVLSKNYYGTLPFEYKMAKTPEDREKALEKVMKTKDGQFTNAVFGMTKFLLKVINEQKPTHLVIAWDVSRNTFRRNIYSDYKAQRSETPSPLKSQFALAQKFFEFCGFYQGILEGVEADDIIGTFAKKFENDTDTYIITGDQDALQLITDKTSVWLTTSKAKDLYANRGINIKDINIPDGTFEFTPQSFLEEYKLNPIQIIDMKAIEGDTSDNIPGVKGVGPTSVVPLLQKYGTVEAIYEAIENNSEDELKTLWKEELGISRSPIANLMKKSNKELAELAKTLLNKEVDKKVAKEIIKILKTTDDKTFKEKVKSLSEKELDTFNEKATILIKELSSIETGIVGKESAFLSKELATIKTDIENYSSTSLDSLLLNIDKEKIKFACERLEFNSLIDKI